MLRVDNFHIVAEFDIPGHHPPWPFFRQVQGDFVNTMDDDCHSLEIQENIDNVFLYTLNRGVLVQDPLDLAFHDGGARNGR